MKFDPQKHQRRSIRLKGYDYSQPGAYFVTLCTWRRDCLFGEVEGGVLRLNEVGNIVEAELKRLPRQFPNMRLDAFVVMPNHIHGIIVITEPREEEGATRRSSPGTSSSDQPSFTNSWDCEDGSPLQPAPPVRATHPSPSTIDPGDQPSTHQPGENQAGSPLQPAPPVRATHPLPTTIDPGDQPSPNQPGENQAGSPLQPAPGPASGSLGVMMGQFKSRATKRIWTIPKYANTPIWQRNYYEHIIRNEMELKKIWDYIETNPEKWMADQLHPAALPNKFNQEK